MIYLLFLERSAIATFAIWLLLANTGVGLMGIAMLLTMKLGRIKGDQ